MRRKGERPIIRRLEIWSPAHPVARAIATGDHWFGAWQRQNAIPFARLARQTGISEDRLEAMNRGDSLTRNEADALARAFGISTADLIASMPDAELVRE
ncbi:helix-turn-helix domain-containing protein [Flavisphingomonas formosensis]|uniref:helix-turn-helix domain-containing protein n=1 Tax=Flavisphingomonas formosensis TaxID=861534 RepID=UPI0018DF641A|nr:helix-turn-helix transcriptional regulator [Sphingomonas formosensis]